MLHLIIQIFFLKFKEVVVVLVESPEFVKLLDVKSLELKLLRLRETLQVRVKDLVDHWQVLLWRFNLDFVKVFRFISVSFDNILVILVLIVGKLMLDLDSQPAR